MIKYNLIWFKIKVRGEGMLPDLIQSVSVEKERDHFFNLSAFVLLYPSAKIYLFLYQYITRTECMQELTLFLKLYIDFYFFIYAQLFILYINKRAQIIMMQLKELSKNEHTGNYQSGLVTEHPITQKPLSHSLQLLSSASSTR